MFRSKLFWTLVLASLFVPAAAGFSAWKRAAQPPAFNRLQDLAALPQDPGKLLLASSSSVLQGPREGPWQNVWSIPGAASPIERLFVFQGLPDKIFILTRAALRLGELGGRSPEFLYRADESTQLLTLSVLPEDPEHWFLGTSQGLLETDNSGKTWYRFRFLPDGKPVSVLSFINGVLYAGSGNTLYRSEDLKSFHAVFSLSAANSENDVTEKNETTSAFHDLTAGENKLWLATSNGIYENIAETKNWSRLPDTGLQSLEISRLIYSEHARLLFAATDSGIYYYLAEEKRWQEMVSGMAARAVKALALAGADKRTLSALTGEGVLYLPLPEARLPRGEEIRQPVSIPAALFYRLVRLEPSARDIQKEVIRYANVHRGKTKNWQWQSRVSALIPTFSFGSDYGRANNIDLDRGSTSQPDTYIFGPDDIDRGWDMDLAWDLGDLIWSSNQTSIDSREKLTVELRNELVADATRIYYERRRLQMEILFSRPATAQEHFEKLMRMDELTALLDGMTDGFMSERLSSIYEANPELERLWFPKINGSGEGYAEAAG